MARRRVRGEPNVAEVYRTMHGKHADVFIPGYGEYAIDIAKDAFSKKRRVRFRFRGEKSSAFGGNYIGGYLTPFGLIEWEKDDDLTEILDEHGVMFDRLFMLLMDPNVPPKGKRYSTVYELR